MEIAVWPAQRATAEGAVHARPLTESEANELLDPEAERSESPGEGIARLPQPGIGAAHQISTQLFTKL
jgi:hypothetical protein